MDTAPNPQASPDPQTEPAAQSRWHGLYTSERRKAHILGATTVAASLLAVAAGAWGLSNTGASAKTTP